MRKVMFYICLASVFGISVTAHMFPRNMEIGHTDACMTILVSDSRSYPGNMRLPKVLIIAMNLAVLKLILLLLKQWRAVL